MKAKALLFFLLIGLSSVVQAQESTITISGRVTDYEGNPIDSSTVRLIHANFSDAYITYTDADGRYSLEGVEKGSYAALYILRPEEYPRSNAVPKEDMRLEFWAWNVIADRDLTIDARYHKLELYGTTVFKQIGGYPSMFVYFRPMSVTRYISYEELFLDKAKMEANNVDLSVKPEFMDVEVYADDQPLTIYSVQAIEEYIGETGRQLGYLVQTSLPKRNPDRDRDYIIFRVVGTNREYDEKGENVYFYELKDYK